MKLTGYLKLSGVFLILIAAATAVFASTPEKYLSEAAHKAKQGNLEAAAVLYQKTLNLDKNNAEARKGLANVLMEARLKDPEVEQSDVELAVIEEAVASEPSSISSSR